MSTTNVIKLKKPVQELADYAVSQGWKFEKTNGGHIRFTKNGCSPIYTSSTPSDQRSMLNARARLRRADHVFEVQP